MSRIGDRKRWDGIGDPGIGELLRFRSPKIASHWLRGYILTRHYVPGSVFLWARVDGSLEPITFNVRDTEFRSIMSDEDRAVSTMQKECEAQDCMTFSDPMARALYRAGYRKQ